MEYTITAIPTTYKGRLYRSRLEARWASMFDQLGWQVEYEPCDFNGWIPDFVIAGEREIYVEVKPITLFHEETAAELERSGCKTEMLILGSNLGPGLQLGWLWDLNFWDEAVVGIWQGTEGKYQRPKIPLGNPQHIIGFCHAVNGFSDRITGFYDGGSYGSGPNPAGRLHAYWNAAGNSAQWKPPIQGGK